MKYTVLTNPLTQDQIKKSVAEHPHGYVSGVISVDLSEVIDNDFEDFLDILSCRLLDDSLLMDTSYTVVGNEGNTLHLQVTGDPSECSSMRELIGDL